MITLQEKFIIVTEVFERGFTYNQTGFPFESLTLLTRVPSSYPLSLLSVLSTLK